jgi:ankyrin repeat protein
MAQSTVVDLTDWPNGYVSSRDVGDVLLGEDTARVVIEASLSGDDTALQSLLSQPHWIKTMLETTHCIYREDEPKQNPDHVREVSAMRMSHLGRALDIAAQNGHASVVSTLLAFAKQQCVDTMDIITYSLISKTLWNGHAAVFKALATADSRIFNIDLGHCALPLYEAVRRQKPEVVAVLLEHGADPLHPVGPWKKLYNYRSSLLSFAAMIKGPRTMEMLLERNVPIAQTGALHTAAHFGQLDTMRLLIQYGADLNEIIPGWREWTPMHFAAARDRFDAMELLKHSGARTDLKDEKGKTPAEILALPKRPGRSAFAPGFYGEDEEEEDD